MLSSIFGTVAWFFAGTWREETNVIESVLGPSWAGVGGVIGFELSVAPSRLR